MFDKTENREHRDAVNSIRSNTVVETLVGPTVSEEVPWAYQQQHIEIDGCRLPDQTHRPDRI